VWKCILCVLSIHIELCKVKGKVVPVLIFVLTGHNAMKAYWGVEVYFCVLLTSALHAGEW
jgi:hypothetical protein